jgi:N-acetylmuramoyl-L-alanine amidase
MLIGAMQEPEALRIAVTKTVDHGDSVTIRIRATGLIPSYQRPEVQRRSVVVRVPGATFALDCEVPLTLTCSNQVIRDVAVLRLGLPWDVAGATVRRDGPRDLVVSIRRVAVVEAATSDSATAAEAATPKERPVPSAVEPGRKHWDLDVIVIDPGHGGVDGGAEGVNGALEKTIVLSIGKRLRDLIRKHLPGTTVVMTRDDDRFIELYRRGQIANEAGGKLFISIHCNSMPTKPHPARGSETYILRPGRNADAARVAARENASISYERSQDRYKGLDNDQLIVATMAQRSFVRLSESFAQAMQDEVASATPLANRGVSQAGFFVLVGASMPNVLFETAFLSNPADAAYISSDAGQAAVAQGMLRAIQRYARTYRTLLQR